VLSTKSFSADRVSEILRGAGVPEIDHDDVLAYSRQQFQSLHEGNLIRYKLKIEDLVGVDFSRFGEGKRMRMWRRIGAQYPRG